MNNDNGKNQENSSLVIFETDKQPIYYSFIPFKYNLVVPDSLDIRLRGKNVYICEEKKYFNIKANPNYTRAEIYVINNKTSDTIQTVELTGILPPISLMFCGINSGYTIPASYFTKESAILATLINFDINIHYEIVSYTMLMQSGDTVMEYQRVIDCKNWKIWEEPREECQFFSQEQLDAIHRIKGSQIVVFKDIVIQLDSNYLKIQVINATFSEEIRLPIFQDKRERITSFPLS
jgi:hypothetical protein